MTTFSFAHNTWDIPPNIDVRVGMVDHDPTPIWDFDFYRGGEVVSYVDWEEAGIRRVESTPHSR